MGEQMSQNGREDANSTWVQRYLKVIGVEAAQPSLAALARLTRAHLLAIPFENITALLRRRDSGDQSVPRPDHDQLLTNWESRSGAGVCFDTGPMAYRLLSALGYDARPILGAISSPGGHNAVAVTLDGQEYIVDVATGAPMFDPVPVGGVFEFQRFGLSFRFGPGTAPNEWLQERLIDGEWRPHCRYDLGPFDPELQERAYQNHHTPGKTWVIGSITVVRNMQDRLEQLKDDTLVTHTAGGKSVRRLESVADYEEVAADVFGMPGLPIAEGVAYRTWLRDLAAQPSGVPFS
jgi:N-hydroxyarylamine O-acetyltransferase